MADIIYRYVHTTIVFNSLYLFPKLVLRRFGVKESFDDSSTGINGSKGLKLSYSLGVADWLLAHIISTYLDTGILSFFHRV